MDPAEVLFVLFGIKITLALMFTIVAGALGVAGALYKLIERWLTREARRLDMLRQYLDKEEKDITGRRPGVLDGIRMWTRSLMLVQRLTVRSNFWIEDIQRQRRVS
jgi:hypothetical protein